MARTTKEVDDRDDADETFDRSELTRSMVEGLTKGPAVSDWKRVAMFVVELNRLRKRRHKALRELKLAREAWEEGDFAHDRAEQEAAYRLQTTEDKCKELRLKIDGTVDLLEKEVAQVAGGTLWTPPPEPKKKPEDEPADVEGQTKFAGVA